MSFLASTNEIPRMQSAQQCYRWISELSMISVKKKINWANFFQRLMSMPNWLQIRKKVGDSHFSKIDKKFIFLFIFVLRSFDMKNKDQLTFHCTLWGYTYQRNGTGRGVCYTVFNFSTSKNFVNNLQRNVILTSVRIGFNECVCVLMCHEISNDNYTIETNLY